MDRTIVCCLLACLVGIALPGCGRGTDEATPPDLLEAEAPAPLERERGPVLRGRGAAPAPDEAAADAHGRIRVPPSATWASVQAALRTSAKLRRAREHLPEYVAVLVPLPDVRGHVIVGGVPDEGASGVGLSLQDRPARTDVRALGVAWIVRGGCEVPRGWTADGWSLPHWRECLERLQALDEPAACVTVRADGDVPAATVLAFLDACAQAGFEAPFVETSHRREFMAPMTVGSNWLAAHQAPTGAWDDRVAEGLCLGRRIDAVPVEVDPGEVANTGQTGLVLCGFLGAGYTNRGRHPFAKLVSRGLRHLKNTQRPDGVFVAAPGWSQAVAHGFAALAMTEVYGMTGSPIWKGSAQRGLNALEITYWGAGDDPLATVLTAMPLRSAQLINKDAVKRGKPAPLVVDAELVEQVHKEARSYDATAGNVRAACGMLTRIFFGEDPGKTKDLRQGALQLVETYRKAGARSDPVFTWLGTLVCFQAGGKAWDAWKQLLETHGLDRQRKDGHVCCQRGSWDPPDDATVPGGRVSATALHHLALEVFYRYDRVFGVR